MPGKVLVVGGTGMIGKPVVSRLAADGYDVRVMSRGATPGRVDAPGAEVIVGDPRDAAAVRQAVEGCNGIYLNLPSGAELAVASAASEVGRAAGVARIVAISGATVCEENRWFPPIEQKLRAEEVIRQSGIPYTILRPSWFMESLPRFVVKGRAAVFGDQPHPFRWVAADDYARLVEAALERAEAANKALHVLGPEPILMHDALRRYCAALHPGITVSTMPIWLVKALAFVTRKPLLASIASLMAYFDRVGEMGDTAETERLLGTPATTLDQWIAGQVARP